MRSFLFYAISIISLTISLFVHGQPVSPCLVSSGLVTGNCFSVGDPYIESPCIAGIQKQIARSVNAENLVEWITPVQCSGWIGVNGTPYQESLIPSGNTPVNCTPPYDKCYGHYCPDKYCAIIKTFVDLKASMILRAVNTWANHAELQPGTLYYQGMKQIVIDINAAFDCAGLRRPIIQAGIFENIDPAVAAVPIPADIINAFKSTAGFENNYYLDAWGNPKQLNFNRERIRHLVNATWPDCPDITRIEAKMWFYYLAKMYIDLGYKSIHMGQMNLWAAQDPSYYNTSIVLNKIRSYAQSKNTFVLLTEENNRAKKFPGTNNFMYDYDSRAIRAREVGFLNGIPVCGDFGCTNPISYTLGGPCINESKMAIMDECVMTYGGNTSGYSPVSGCMLPYQPFNTYLDFGPGDYPPVGVASMGCLGNWGTWGWDDTKWFAKGLQTSACRAFWLQDAICRARTYFNGFGFLSLPGILYVNMPTNAGQYLVGNNPTADARYLMSDELIVRTTGVMSWTVNADPGITSSVTCGPIIGTCDFNGLSKRIRTTRFSVYEPDCTSSYSWHVKNPDNSWQAMVYGKERSLSVPVPGIYTIYLRIDNLGLPNGVKEIVLEQYLEPYCCFPLEIDLAKQAKADTAISEPVVYRNLPESFEELPVSQGAVDNNEHVSNVLFHNENNDVAAFPSPTSSLFTIKATGPDYSGCSFMIKDVTGRTVFKSGGNVNLNTGMSITCKEWANGIYFISVSSRKGTNSVLKIVKF